MSMVTMVKAMHCRVGNPIRKLVLIKMADNANDKGECWPSYQYIADVCEISKRSVIAHINALCEMGLIQKTTRMGKKGNTSNLYLIQVPRGALDSLGGEFNSLGGAGDSLGGSAGDSPRISHSLEPVKEPVTIKTHTPTSQTKIDPRVTEIFEYWCSVMQKDSRTKLTGKRKSRISARLKDGYTVDEIKLAIKGCAKNPWNMGDNPTGAVHDDLELICRDDAKLKRFISIATKSEQPYSSVTARNIQTLQDLELE